MPVNDRSLSVQLLLLMGNQARHHVGTVQRVEQECAAVSQRSIRRLQHALVLTVVFEVAEGCEQRDNRAIEIASGNLAHVGLYQLDIQHGFGVEPYSGLGEKILR